MILKLAKKAGKPFNVCEMQTIPRAYPNIIQFKISYSSKEYTSIKATATMAGRKVANLYPIAAYNEPPKISTKKKEGLLYLCDNNYIPIQHHHFYKELTTAEDVEDPV
ncbi:hypothetical protein QE152_g38863 [Popillia japonica]|uniref:Uncharacterized protein n=1 Tax=Popillia japonica TaxID=7064 RepID=A0AAW1HWD2_POPJA